MKAPTTRHPYDTASDLIAEADARLTLATRAHAAARTGDGSDSTTAEHARATIRTLRDYLEEVGQPEHDEEEDRTESAHRVAASKYEHAKRAHARALSYASETMIDNHRAQVAATESAKRAKETKARADDAEEQRIRTGRIEAEARAELQRHQDARDADREGEAK